MICFFNRFMVYALILFLICPENIFLSGGFRGAKFQAPEEKPLIIDEYNNDEGDDDIIEVFGEDNDTEEKMAAPDILNMLNLSLVDAEGALDDILLSEAADDSSIMEIEEDKDKDEEPDILIEGAPRNVIVTDEKKNTPLIEVNDDEKTVEVMVPHDQCIEESKIGACEVSDELDNNLDDPDTDTEGENVMPSFSLVPISSNNIADDQDDDDNDEDIDQEPIVVEEEIVVEAPQDDKDTDDLLDIEMSA